MSEKPIYVQLMDSIKKKIQDGQLQVGDRLVSEREMSEQYGINRMTVRNALKKLQEEGVIETKRGSGNYVAKFPYVEEKLELGRAGVYSLSAQIRQKGMKSSRKTLSLTKIKSEDKLKEVFPNEDYIYMKSFVYLISMMSLMHCRRYIFLVLNSRMQSVLILKVFHYMTIWMI